MSGFEKTKFLNLPQSVAEELTCGICLKILNNPMTTPCCSQSYCRQCVLQCLQMSSNANKCPNDRKPLLPSDLIKTPRIVTNILDKQEVYCDHRSYGCPQIVQLSQLVNHLNKCSFDPNRAFNKCHQILDNLEVTVEQMENKINGSHLKKDFKHLKTQIIGCKHELNVMNSNKLIEPFSESFKNKIIESAKRNVLYDGPIIRASIRMPHTMKDRVIYKCKQAINNCNDYNKIAKYLTNSLNNGTHVWSASVYPYNSSVNELDYSHEIELVFGNLCILLISNEFF